MFDSRLALFDLDDTLIDRVTGVRRWALEFCAARGLGAPDTEWMVEADGNGLVPRGEYLTKVRERFSLTEPVEDLWAGYLDRQPRLSPAFPGALAGLDALRHAGWLVGVVTNGPADLQHAGLTHSGVRDHVNGWAISGAEDVHKPERRLFEIAAERCGTTLTEGGWMVGDSAQSDVRGGRGAGLRTVWIDHGRPWPDGRPAPDHTVGGVGEAVTLMLDR